MVCLPLGNALDVEDNCWCHPCWLCSALVPSTAGRFAVFSLSFNTSLGCCWLAQHVKCRATTATTNGRSTSISTPEGGPCMPQLKQADSAADAVAPRGALPRGTTVAGTTTQDLLPIWCGTLLPDQGLTQPPALCRATHTSPHNYCHRAALRFVSGQDVQLMPPCGAHYAPCTERSLPTTRALSGWDAHVPSTPQTRHPSASHPHASPPFPHRQISPIPHVPTSLLTPLPHIENTPPPGMKQRHHTP